MICSLFKMSLSSHFNIYTSSTVGTEPSLGRKITGRCPLLFVPLSLPSLWRKVWLCRSNLSPKPRKASPLLPACQRGENELLSMAHLNITVLLGSGSLSFTLFAVFFYSVFVSKDSISIRPCPNTCAASSPARRWSVPTMELAPSAWCPIRLLPPQHPSCGAFLSRV